MNVGSLREALHAAIELNNLDESREVLVRHGTDYYELETVSLGFNAPTGKFILILTAIEAP